MRGRLSSMFCNFCGSAFETPDRWQRCCSVACAHGLSAAWTPPHERAPIPRRQGEIMRVFRTAGLGTWLGKGEICAAAYGVDDDASRRAFTMLLHRMRGCWGAHGLVIEARVDRQRLDSDGESYYRLVSDIDEMAAAS